MKPFELLDKKQKIIVIGISIVAMVTIIYYFYTKYQEIEGGSETFEQEEIEESNEISQEESETEEVIIHISGAVKEEGIITIKQGARISDAIEAAGGLQDNASLKNVNLAYMLEDGEKIYIPTKEEEEEQEETTYTIVQEGNNSSNTNNKKGENAKVNINKATQTELEELPGIGSSTALKIIQYREENGKFQSIEDIKNVNGIGDAKYHTIQEYITV